MGTETARVAPYYSVKLNIPWHQADTIRALVPEGKPMSGTLIEILLKVAQSQGIPLGDAVPSLDRLARAEEALSRLQDQVRDLTDRLDAALATLGRRA